MGPLDAARHRPYKAHDDMEFGDHYSNYMPGALKQTSRRDKAYGLPRRPITLT